MFYRRFILIISLLFFSVFNYTLSQVVLTEDDDVNISAIVGSTVITNTNTNFGGVVLFPNTAVQFKGRAYPNATVYLLKDGIFVSSVKANHNAYFNINIPEEEVGSNMYTLYAVDTDEVKSVFLNFPTNVKEGFLNFLNNILFAPTISSDKIEIQNGGSVNFSGFAFPNANLEITFKSSNFQKSFQLISNKDGKYNINLSAVGIPKGDYSVFTNYVTDTRISKLLRIIIGDKDIFKEKKIEYLPGDCNKDNIINLIDFSVLAFWYKKDNPPLCVDTNADKIIDLIDFSILAYYWNN